MPALTAGGMGATGLLADHTFAHAEPVRAEGSPKSERNPRSPLMRFRSSGSIMRSCGQRQEHTRAARAFPNCSDERPRPKSCNRLVEITEPRFPSQSSQHLRTWLKMKHGQRHSPLSVKVGDPSDRQLEPNTRLAPGNQPPSGIGGLLCSITPYIKRLLPSPGTFPTPFGPWNQDMGGGMRGDAQKEILHFGSEGRICTRFGQNACPYGPLAECGDKSGSLQ